MFIELGKEYKELYRHQSTYNSIQVFETIYNHKLLVCDGIVQVHEGDEYRYHECLAIVPYLFTHHARNILIVGGGDGLCAKQLFRFPIDSITIVEIDPEIPKICKTFINGSEAFENKKVKIIHQDAIDFVSDVKYELIICDLTDPSHEYSARLYTFEYLEHLKSMLTKDGTIATQAVGPLYQPKAFWCLYNTYIKAFPEYNVLAYKCFLPFVVTQIGFIMATPNPISVQIPEDLKYIDNFNFSSLFSMDKDERIMSQTIIGNKDYVSTKDNLMYANLFEKPYLNNIKEFDLEKRTRHART